MPRDSRVGLNHTEVFCGCCNDYKGFFGVGRCAARATHVRDDSYGVQFPDGKQEDGMGADRVGVPGAAQSRGHPTSEKELGDPNGWRQAIGC